MALDVSVEISRTLDKIGYTLFGILKLNHYDREMWNCMDFSTLKLLVKPIQPYF